MFKIGGLEVNLDFYCEQIRENGKAIKRINVEIQNESSGAIPKRARFHSSSLDSVSLKVGDKFKDLSENYVIFIAKKDIFTQKQALYNIQRYIEFTDEKGDIKLSYTNFWITRKNKKTVRGSRIKRKNEGIAEGEKIGMANAMLGTAKRMIKKRIYSLEEIAKNVNLSLSEVQALSAQMS